MDINKVSLEDYIASIDEKIRESIIGMNDIEIDGFNSEGANGYVFFGNHKIFRIRVAVKYYYFGEDSHEEVSLIKNINSNNLLRVWDARTVGDGWAYFITDEMTNGTLDSYIAANNICTFTAIDIVKGLLSGVGKLHEAPNYLLHRDLKPANILVDSKGNPVIADFGSIKRLPQSQDKVNASRDTALYRPPEAYDQGHYMIQSDIYQIGMVMYQLLGGYLPYGLFMYMNKVQIKFYEGLADDFEKSKYVDELIYQKSKKAKLLNLASLPYYIHPKLIKIIKKATNPEIEKRYQNTADFYLQLHQIGTIPNWVRKNDEYVLCEFKSTYYRILNGKKGYILERSKDNVNWRKAPGIGNEPTEEAVYKKLILK